MRVSGPPRIECRGDDFHFHFAGSPGSEIVFDIETLWQTLATLKPALAAFIRETELARAGEGAPFERIERLEPADSLASH